MRPASAPQIRNESSANDKLQEARTAIATTTAPAISSTAADFNAKA